MGHWADLFGPGSDGLSTGLPIPSRDGGDCVRLVSESSVHLPLSTVEGLRAGAFRAH
ncbi:unnamed protein product, partial [Brassica oleracea]